MFCKYCWRRNFISKKFLGNGPEFETAARQKHENNPKFAFLRGGDYQHYYAFRVQAEKTCKIFVVLFSSPLIFRFF